MERSVLNTEEFKQFAASDFVLYKAEYPRKLIPTLADQVLKDRYNVNAFPTALVVDSTGAEKGRIRGADALRPYLGRLRDIVN